MKRLEMIALIDQYYQMIDRVKKPKFEDYTLRELRSCIVLFKLNDKK